MDIRNPIYTADGRINCEIDHPALGWIPFTAAHDDVEEHGRSIYAIAAEMDVAPYVAPAPEPVDLYALAASLRWHKEIGGIEVGGVMITTDDRSKTLLQGARTAADANPDHIEGWKTATGWVDLTAAQIIAMSDAVRAHVSNCFALERAVAGQIADGTITTPAQVQAAFA